MKTKQLLLILLLFPISIHAQIISKPIGCYLGTNGTNTAAMAHSESRGVLLVEKWSDIEVTPGVYDFTNLDNKITIVKNAGLKYALAISGGAFGSPNWLIDSLNTSYHSFQYQNQNWRLPMWWDSICQDNLNSLITELGNQYANDSMLSHVYVTQMTVNGIEGHLNGVNMDTFTTNGYTSQKWIEAAKTTTLSFAQTFPTKPIVFEIHEIDNDTLVPATIINELTNEPILCERFGLAMWWISGKTSYQTDLIDYIKNYEGDKYAQIIGRSDQTHRFQDSLYSTVFTQAKSLGVRYIEPWPYEFQYNTNDSLIHNFNVWADTIFQTTDTCNQFSTNIQTPKIENILISPNPTKDFIHLKINKDYQSLKIVLFDIKGQKIQKIENETIVNISHLNKGIYYAKIYLDNKSYVHKIIKN